MIPGCSQCSNLSVKSNLIARSEESHCRWARSGWKSRIMPASSPEELRSSTERPAWNREWCPVTNKMSALSVLNKTGPLTKQTFQDGASTQAMSVVLDIKTAPIASKTATAHWGMDCKVTSTWMAGPKFSQQNITQSIPLPLHQLAFCILGTRSRQTAMLKALLLVFHGERNHAKAPNVLKKSNACSEWC